MSAFTIMVIISVVFLFIGIICFGLFEKGRFVLFILTGIGMLAVLTVIGGLKIINEPKPLYDCNLDFSNSSDENVVVKDYELIGDTIIFTYEDGSVTYLHLRDNDSVTCIVRSD